MFIEVVELERRKVHFNARFAPCAIVLANSDWRQSGELHASGVAELLDRSGSRTIRVRGRIEGGADGHCARCLEPVSKILRENFDLFYYPMAMIACPEEIRIEWDDMDLGFYEGGGIELGDVIREQLLLWLPMQALCDENCLGICSRCGSKRGLADCRCEETFVDPRWDALREFRSKMKS